jgi:hypothetical protein
MITKPDMLAAITTIVSGVVSIIGSFAIYTWRAHQKEIKKQTEILVNMDKNMALVGQKIDNHSDLLEDGKRLHGELQKQINDHETRITVLETRHEKP